MESCKSIRCVMFLSNGKTLFSLLLTKFKNSHVMEIIRNETKNKMTLNSRLNFPDNHLARNPIEAPLVMMIYVRIIFLTCSFLIFDNDDLLVSQGSFFLPAYLPVPLSKQDSGFGWLFGNVSDMNFLNSTCNSRSISSLSYS